jgi:hypothetical protein
MNKKTTTKGNQRVTAVQPTGKVTPCKKCYLPEENQGLTRNRVTKGSHFSQTLGRKNEGTNLHPKLGQGGKDPFIESGYPGYPGYPTPALQFAVQPPVIRAMLRDEVSTLVKAAHASKANSLPDTKPIGSIADRYFVQITAWVSGLSPLQKLRRYSIGEVMLLAALKGHYRDHASLRYTGEALRRCGFKQKRDWTAAGRNKRYWQFVGEEK